MIRRKSLRKSCTREEGLIFIFLFFIFLFFFFFSPPSHFLFHYIYTLCICLLLFPSVSGVGKPAYNSASMLMMHMYLTILYISSMYIHEEYRYIHIGLMLVF